VELNHWLNKLALSAAGLAFVALVTIALPLRLLPESIAMPLFFALVPTMLLGATVGAFLGAAGFRKTRDRRALAAFFIGEGVLVTLLCYSLAPWVL
jgi:hypothetical protein